jgi:hypothetical protein
MVVQLPLEIKEKILSYFVPPRNVRSFRNNVYYQTLGRLALCDQTWHALVMPILYSEVVLVRQNMFDFVAGVLYSAQHEAKNDKLESIKFQDQIQILANVMAPKANSNLEISDSSLALDATVLLDSASETHGSIGAVQSMSQPNSQISTKPRQTPCGNAKYIRKITVPSDDPLLPILDLLFPLLNNCTQ